MRRRSHADSEGQSPALPAKLEEAIQQELTILADIEARYADELYRLARSRVPEAVKEHLLRELDRKRGTARKPHALRLADLQRQLSSAHAATVH